MATLSSTSPWTVDGTFIIEYARRAHTCCRTCERAIATGGLRVGIVYQHRQGYICINWHHVECFPQVAMIAAQNLEGYEELEAQHQEMLQQWRQQQHRKPSIC